MQDHKTRIDFEKHKYNADDGKGFLVVPEDIFLVLKRWYSCDIDIQF
jgi:hypothetical protein